MGSDGCKRCHGSAGLRNVKDELKRWDPSSEEVEMMASIGSSKTPTAGKSRNKTKDQLPCQALKKVSTTAHAAGTDKKDKTVRVHLYLSAR